QFSAHDFGLVEAGFVSPCPASTTLTREYFNAPWYRAWTYQTAANSDRLYQLSGQCDLPFTGQVVKMQVCDAAGNCTTASPELLPKVSLATAAPSAAPSPSGEGGVLILEPSPSTFLTTTLPLQIQGGAFSPGFVKSLTIRDGNRVIDNLHWAHLAITDTTWTTTWTPDGEGPHQIEATLRDWTGGAYTDTVTVILDTQPPEVAITTAVLTSTHVAGGQVTVAGTANDANGITAVDLQARGVWRPARIEDGTWTATWIPDLGKPPDGQIFTGVARAVDRAGWSTLASGDVYVDAASPAPVDLALSYQTAGETIPITRTGTTIREAVGALEMAWTASSDGSGLADYRAGWTAVGADGSATTSWIILTPEEPRLATATAGEAQKLVASLETSDLYGNTTRQAFGPVYVDSPLTPDYMRLNSSGGSYHGWMDSGCTLLGTDRRLSRVLGPLAQHDGEQALYGTWDDQALRLAWNGANWSAEGDLFVYMDTKPGGSNTVFDPYTPANALSAAGSSDATLVALPGSIATATQSEAMLADYGVWVEDAQTAWLLAWDGSTWITTTLLSTAQYRYQPSEQGGLTDLYLPFDLLEITNPAMTPLGLLAFATEEDALRIWAVLPGANPVTSLQVTGAFGHLLEALTVPMSHYYRWPSLDSGICPNGRLGLDADQTPYPDADVEARLKADPAGTVYNYLGDHLYSWSDELLGDTPLDFSRVLEFLDRDHPYVHDGQLVTYTLHLQNKGQDATHEVMARVWSAAALTLPGGAPVGGDEHLYFQEIPIGDLAPGQELSLTFQGRIDLAWARPRYEQCLATYPDRPRLCELALRFALLKVEIVDQTYTTPLERIWADHRVDFEAPRFAGIDQSSMIISAGSASLRGYAYDDSGVPLITLEVRRPDGRTISLDCPNPNPDSGIWTCKWDPTEVNDGVPPEDGQIFQVRLLATDGAGLTSEPGPWYPFVVDTEPPAVTAQLPTVVATGLPVSARTVRLAGSLADNHGAAGVEVCLEDNCRSASTTLEGQPTLLQYDDLPATTVPLASCETAPIQRTFLVT
ncbi:MAG: Ig-like domain-containing protein, partial [Chloroflexota bacterium]